MKKLIVIMTLLTLSGATYAQSTGESRDQTVSGGGAAAQQQASAIVVFESPSDTTTTLKNVPAIGAPALASSNDTCMGSTSGGVAMAGFGLSLGSTWSDKNCLMLKNSRELWNMGMKAAAMARMCMDDLNKEALELTGFVCPTKKAE